MFNSSRTGTVDNDLSQPFSDVLLRSMGLQSNPQTSLNRNSNFSDTWMNNLHARQTLQDKKLENLSKTMTTVSIAFQGADSVCNSTKQMVQEIKQTLDDHASRIDEIESEARRFKAKTNQKIQNIQEWIEEIKEKSVPEVPPEITSSLQEVINDSAPVLAVESMREEMRDLRRTVVSGQHVGGATNLGDRPK